MLQGSQQVSAKPHKFFERYLDNDLEKLAAFLQEKYKLIQQVELKGIEGVKEDEAWLDSGSLSTVKWREYNVFQFYSPEIYKIFKTLSEVTREACDYYGVDFDSQQYMVQGWFNINHSDVGKLNWHDQNENKNNRLIVSEMGHPHAMGDWTWEGARITLAYDIEPLNALIENDQTIEQHWVPLL